MNSILELTAKLLPITEATMRVYEKTPQLFPLQDVVKSLQFTYYWFQAAEVEMSKLQGEDPIEHDTKVEGLVREYVPTLIGTQAYIDYLREQLTILTDSTNTYIDSSPLPPGVEYKLRQGYNRLMEGLFSTKLSHVYYEQFNKPRGI